MRFVIEKQVEHGGRYATIAYENVEERMMKKIRAIAEAINALAVNYKMGKFQEMRSRMHGLSRPHSRNIFTDQTIHETWACHSGGRTEIQFNIGFDDNQKEWFRYGLAFSLGASRSLTDPMSLKPRILKLNKYLRVNQSALEDLRFWHWFNGKRSDIMPANPIPKEWIRRDAFLFLGKRTSIETIRPEDVLFLFDRLLDIYQYVEGKTPLMKRSADLHKGFQFKAGNSNKSESAVVKLSGATKTITLHHNKLQANLLEILTEQYGEDYVGTENDTGRGSRVDLVRRDGKTYLYYEIKTGPCIKSCIREATGQLLEYSYWPGGNEATKLVIVTENPITHDARRYLSMLRKRFHLPIYYQQIDLKSKVLGEMQ